MSQNKTNFVEGVHLIFQHWPTLSFVKDHQLGGVDTAKKIEELTSSLIRYFGTDGFQLYPDDIEIFLQDEMLEKFDLEVEEEKGLCTLLCDLFKDCVAGKTDILVKLKTQRPSKSCAEVQIQESEDEDSDESDQEDDENQDDGKNVDDMQVDS